MTIIQSIHERDLRQTGSREESRESGMRQFLGGDAGKGGGTEEEEKGTEEQIKQSSTHPTVMRSMLIGLEEKQNT